MANLKYWIGVLLVFTLGVVAGAVGTGMYIKQKITHLAVGGPPGVPPPEMTDFILRRMSRDLNLNEDQEKKIKKALTETHEKLRLVSEKYQPEFKKILDVSKAAIKACLSPEQAARMDEIQKKMGHRMQGPPPGERPFGRPPRDRQPPFGDSTPFDHGPPPGEPPPPGHEFPPDFPPPLPPR